MDTQPAPQSMDEVLELAIAQEQWAARTYQELALQVERPNLQELLLQLAQQEESHREALERVREGDLELFAKSWPAARELVFTPQEVVIRVDTQAPAVVLAAMDAERRSFLLYSTLAERTDDSGMKTLCGALAREEAHHWSALEIIYDELSGLVTPP